jgi:hypothetical protein
MFILHRHASRNQTLGMVGRELLVEVSIPAQLRQVHSGVPIESFMDYSLRPSPAPEKAEVRDPRQRKLPRLITADVGVASPLRVATAAGETLVTPAMKRSTSLIALSMERQGQERASLWVERVTKKITWG